MSEIYSLLPISPRLVFGIVLRRRVTADLLRKELPFKDVSAADISVNTNKCLSHHLNVSAFLIPLPGF